MSNASGGNGQAPSQPTNQDANGQAPTQPQANNSASPTSAANGQAPTPTQDDFKPPSADEWKRTQQELAEARREAAKHRTEKQTLLDAQLTAEQKRERDYTDMQARHSEATQENQRLKVQVAGYRYADTLRIGDIGAALALVQVEHGRDLKFNEQTNDPENLEDLLKVVLKNHPSLARQEAPEPPQRTPVQSGGAMSPGRAAAPIAQPIPNRPLRTFRDVEWKK